MATLIERYDGEGKAERRCDARCYDAKHEHCNCICGGINHGKGLKVALKNTELFKRETDYGYSFPTLQLTVEDCDC